MSLREALTYLDGLGFDHLYPGGAEPAGSESSAPRDARSGAPSEAQPTNSPRESRQVPPAAQVEGQAPQPAQDAPQDARKSPPRDPRVLLPPTDDAAALAPDVRLQRLDEVRTLSRGCRACRLCEGRNTVVFGSGDPNADLMFIGEGPGAEEDRQGLPFVGAAGELLTKIIEAIDLRRDQVYIANMVKCRPPNNRDPHPDEVAACRPYLERQIDLVRPRVIVALGRVAAQALLQSNDSLGRLRGTWHEVRGVQVRATYHPAALLRYAKYKRPTWEDMKVVRARLAELAG